MLRSFTEYNRVYSANNTGLLVFTWRESKGVPVQAMKAYADGATATRSLNLDIRWTGVVSFMP